MKQPKEWINSLPKPKGTLLDIQKRGRELFLKQDIPTHSIEEWRLTKLERLFQILDLPLSIKSEDEIHPSSNSSFSEQEDKISISLESNQDPLNSIILPEGIEKIEGEKLKKVLNDNYKKHTPGNWPLSINYSSTNKIIGLKINKKNTKELEIIMNAQSNSLNSYRIIILLEENASLNLLQKDFGSKNSAISTLVELHLKKQAKLNHRWIGQGSLDSNLLANCLVEQSIGSIYSLTSVHNGWSFARVEPIITQLDGQANTIIKSLQICTKEEQIETHSHVKFNGPEGNLDQLHKAIATDKSHSIFNGKINVEKIAQKTNASQLSRNLLLSKTARIDTKPELEIIADDVKCAHGATISQLQEEELFYLQSRGIKIREATALLLKAYCQEIINKISINSIADLPINNLLESLNQ